MHQPSPTRLVARVQITYVESGAAGCPLLLLSESTPASTAELARAATRLAEGVTDGVELHRLPGVESAVALRAVVADGHPGGVRPGRAGTGFEWYGTGEHWLDVVGLLEPFLEGVGSGFQWLDQHGRISVLFSPSGRW